jgi:hypothetical protein
MSSTGDPLMSDVVPAAPAAAPDASVLLLRALALPDAILEPTAGETLAAYLAAGGGAKKAVKAMADGYQGRTEMINLLAQWTDLAGGATPSTAAASSNPVAPVASSSSSGLSLITRLLQRAIVRRFDSVKADALLEQSSMQPAWLEALVQSGEWSAVFPELREKSPSSLFLRLCVGLVAEQQLDAQAAAGPLLKREVSLYDGENGSGAGGFYGGSIVTASVRASVLSDFTQFHNLVRSILLAMLDRAMGQNGSDATTVKQEDEMSAKMQHMSFDTLLGDLQRLASTSEYAYLYIQRCLSSLIASAPSDLTVLWKRVEQDVRQYVTHPPVPAVLASTSATSGVDLKNTGVFPLDLWLVGLKEEWLDVFTALHALYRTDQLSMLDVHRIYTRYQAEGERAPPVCAIRDKKFIRTLLTALFSGGDNATIMSESSGGAASARDKYIYLLAYACCVKDDRVCNIRLQKHLDAVSFSSAEFVTATAALRSGPVDRASFEATRAALTKLHDLTTTTQWGLRPNPLLRLIQQNLDVPIVAVAATMWIGAQLTDHAYYDTTYSSNVTPFFLSLLGTISNLHPLLRSTVFSLLSRTWSVSSSMEAFAGIGVKKLLLNVMVHLAHVGMVSEVIQLVAEEIPKGMDHSLVRHFVVQLLHTAAPPYSRLFLIGVLQILALPQTFTALQSMLTAYVKRESQASKTLQDPIISGAHVQSGAAAQLLAAAHVQPNTKAALRLLAAAEMSGQLPASTPSPPPVSTGQDEHATADGPSKKKLKTEEGAVKQEAPVLSKQDHLVQKLLHPAKRPPKPFQQVGTGHDASDSAVLDFCTLLRERPDLLTHSTTARGLVLREENVLMAIDDDPSMSVDTEPIPSGVLMEHIRTLDSYLALKD